MLEDPLLQERYIQHLWKMIDLADKEIDRTKDNAQLNYLAKWYRAMLRNTIFWFEDRCDRRLAIAFARIARRGRLEIMTCSATHGFLPLLKNDIAAVRSQVFTAQNYFESVFGVKSAGIWVPECAYYPGLDKILKEAGINYFFTDSHGIDNATPAPQRGVYEPLYCPSGVAAFGRDQQSSKSVWSAEEGYPGNPLYREFYRDIGHELDAEYLKDILISPEIRTDTGIKYCRITGREDKELYDPTAAREQTKRDAENFLHGRIEQVRHLQGENNIPPIIVCPYDAELFGHWWFEGPMFLDKFFRKCHSEQNNLMPITPAAYLEKHPTHPKATPCGSSWGGEGYYQFWCTDVNSWIYPLLNDASEKMSKAAKQFIDYKAESLEGRAIRQAARELLLAQSSDWPFIMRTGTSPEYAGKRIKDHLARFDKLLDMLASDNVENMTLSALEQTDNIFPDINIDYFAE
jgi:1,4-alpha-glucan branching enzyme